MKYFLSAIAILLLTATFIAGRHSRKTCAPTEALTTIANGETIEIRVDSSGHAQLFKDGKLKLTSENKSSQWLITEVTGR